MYMLGFIQTVKKDRQKVKDNLKKYPSPNMLKKKLKKYIITLTIASGFQFGLKRRGWISFPA